jgi:TolB-like protein/Tfp pilus assembly protein PilF
VAENRSVNPKTFFGELKRRNVYKVAIAYGVVAWLLMQVASQIFPFFEIPNWAVRLVVLLLIIGFPVALILAWAFELTPEGIKRTEVADDLPKKSGRSRAWIYVVIVAGVIASGVFFFGRYTSSTQSAKTPEKSVAMLPFDNLSRDPDNAYFAEGVRDEFLARLSKAADLRVVSIRSTEQLKSSLDHLSQIARKFGVANILAGSVQRSSDEVRVNVQLVRGENNAHLWAEAYDRKLTDIFAVESEIAKTIADTLQAKLTGSERNAIAVQPTQNTEAHQLYLKGRYFWNRRTGENLKKALGYFRQATEKDPSYALAYTGAADTCFLIPVYAAGTPQEYLPRARSAAQKAVELDDALAEAHTSLAYVFFFDFERARSIEEFERAISLNPNYATAHQWYRRGPLSMVGEFNKAITEEKRALELDPVSPIINAEPGTVYTLARRYDEAIAQLRNTVETYPDFYWGHRFFGWALELNGASREAIVEYQKAFDLNDDPVVLAMLAHAEASIGKQTEARQILAQLRDEAKARYVSAYAFAVIHVAFGEKDQALDWLEKAARDHAGPNINLIKVDPYLDPLRGDPRFEALASAVLSGSVK